jgi:tetratricopeptide (TPR) repeat protein
MKEFNIRNQIPFLEGLLIGICLSLIVGFFLVIKNIQQPKGVAIPTFTINAKSEAIPTFTINATPMSTLTFTDLPSNLSTPTPGLSVKEFLRKAQTYLDEGKPEKAKDLLLPVIQDWPAASDKAAGFKLLGDAEMSLLHPQLATPYYEKVYFYNPTPENLFTLAVTYDMGGDLCKAFLHYKELDAWSDPNAQIDREFIKSRIEDISCTLGTPAPTQP